MSGTENGPTVISPLDCHSCRSNASGWLLTDATESGSGSLELSVDYTYNGSGSGWGGTGGGTNGWDSNGHWDSTAHIHQESHSKVYLNVAATRSALDAIRKRGR